MNTVFIAEIDGEPLGFAYSEGYYHLFVCRRKGFFSYIHRYISSDMLDFDGGEAVYKSAYKISGGSALIKNGKLYLIFDEKTVSGYKQRLLVSRDFCTFDLHPLPLIENSRGGLKNPRVLFSEGSYYMLLAAKKGIKLYKSENLLNWQFQDEAFSLPSVNRPSVIKADKDNLLIYSNEGQTAFIGCKINLAKRIYILEDSPRAQIQADGVLSALMQDNRIILIPYVNGKLSVPRETEGFSQSPVRELYAKRAGKTYIPYDGRGFNLETDGAREYVLTLAALTPLAAKDITVEFFGLPVDIALKEEACEIRAFVTDGYVEVYAEGRVFTGAANGNGIRIQSGGETDVKLTGYKLKINQDA